jgi:hypothetical protein
MTGKRQNGFNLARAQSCPRNFSPHSSPRYNSTSFPWRTHSCVPRSHSCERLGFGRRILTSLFGSSLSG